MHNYLRLYFILVLCMLLATTVTGAAAPIELQFHGNPNHMEKLKPIIDDFNASRTDIKVTVVPKDVPPNNIIPAYAAGTPPDIIESAGLYTQQYAAEGMMVDLTALIEKESKRFISDYFPGTMADNTVNGRIYSLPAFLQIEGMYFNPDILGAAGIVEPKPGWTWEDLRNSAKKARRISADGAIEIYGIATVQPRTFDFILLMQARGYFITPDMRVTIDTEPMRAVYKWVLEQIDENILRYRSLGISKDGPTEAKLGNQVAFAAEASYRQDTWNKLNSPMVTAPPLRQTSKSEPVTLVTDRSWGIMNVSPERQAAAWEVLKYLSKPDVTARYCIALGYPVPTRSAMQTRDYQSYMAKNPNMQRWIEWYAPLNPWLSWPAKTYPLINDVLVPIYTQMLKKSISYAEFAENAQKQLNEKMIERFGNR